MRDFSPTRKFIEAQVDFIVLISDKPYTAFKPGQTNTDREYYSSVTQEKPDGSKCL